MFISKRETYGHQIKLKFINIMIVYTMKKMNDKSMMMIQSYTLPLNHFLTHSLRVYGTSGSSAQ